MPGFGAFLRSRKNLLGCVLALAGLAIGLAGLIPLVAAAPVVVGMYLLGVLVGPAEPAPQLHFEVTGDDAMIEASLEQLVRSVQGRVPDDVLLRVQHIRESILSTINDAAGESPERSTADPNVYLIRQTALQYLPTALDAYLALPRRYVLTDLPGRKNAHQLLLSQLVLMDEKLTDVTAAILAQDTASLEVYGRFIAEKFGRSRLDLDHPGSFLAAVQPAGPESDERAAAAEQPVAEQASAAEQPVAEQAPAVDLSGTGGTGADTKVTERDRVR